ncbi:MAG: hypothetical protein Q7T87_05605 [Polaromonas sp.]|nr:hypothetical protein [Polaromonas sp.]
MIIFASQDRWRLFSGDTVRDVAAFPALQEPATVVWHSPQSVTGVAALEGNVRHAAVLIERRLRAEGSIEGDTRMFIHHIRTIGEGYQALYTAAPLAQWQRLLAWASRLPNHCLIFSAAALLWERQAAGSAVVLQAGTQLMAVGSLDNQMVQVNTLAFSDSAEDMHSAAAALGARLLEERSKLTPDQEPAALSIRWCAAGDAATGSAERQLSMMAAIEASNVVDVRPLNTEFRDDAAGVVVHSAIPALAAGAGTRMALNNPGDKWLFMADRFLPACSLAALALSAGVLLTCLSWYTQSRETASQVDKLVEQESAARMRAAALGERAKPPEGLENQLAFVAVVKSLEGGHDLSGALKALKAAAREDLRILSVRSDDNPSTSTSTSPPGAERGATASPVPPDKPPAIVVDGILAEGGNSESSQLLSGFVRALREQGYEAEPIDTKGAATGLSASSRLFSYRLTRLPERVELRR